MTGAATKEKCKPGTSWRDEVRKNFRSAWIGVYVIWLRDVTRFWRDTPRRIGAFFQPILYLFLLGTGLQSAFKAFGGSDVKYVLFMFPGILGMTVLFTAVFSSISIVWDREFGFLKEVLVSPIPRSSVAVGKVIGGATTALMQGMVLLVLAFLPMFFGFSLSTLYKVLALLPVIALLAVAMTALGVVVAARMRSFEGFPIIMNFILMPLFFLSGAMFPLQGLPGWMTFLTRINPLTYGVDALRGICLRGVQITTATSVTTSPAMINTLGEWQTQWNIPSGAISDLGTRLQAVSQSSMPTLQVQRYPMWLDLVVILGFTVVLVALAIWQFGKQD
jgi:ABC-2 type transport system permease protein